jgi:hypothetical protein
VTPSRPANEEWNPRGDWRNFLATLVSMMVYSVPWFVLSARWPLLLAADDPRLPSPAFSLGLGVGWFVTAVLLLAVVVPSLLERFGRRELAWRWRRGAIHAAWFGLVVTSGSAAMRLPLSNGLRVLAAVALAAVEFFAVRWLARKSRVT